MEHPVAGLATRRKVPKTVPLVHGGTSLKFSDGGNSPLLEAHPGSPVDLTGRRPSLAASLASSARSNGSNTDLRSPRSPRLGGRIEGDVRGGGMAAKESTSVSDREENNEMKPPQRRMQVATVQPFYIPAKVPEEIQVQTTPVSGDGRMSVDTAMEMDFDFETDNGIWISAHPIPRSESRTSLATTTTTSTLIDDRYSHGALTIDTSVASSATSMISSSEASIQSATSSDIYGWEEELDRKSSIDGHSAWEREMSRRLPSGGRTMGPRSRGVVQDYQYKRAGEGRRKSLLYRVLNISGRRGSEDFGMGLSTMPTSAAAECPTTSA